MRTKYQKDSYNKSLIALIVLVVFAFTLISSCKPREKCAAFGEHKRFKVEHPY
ncbi:MAG: hypothetical protein U1C46_08015 [Bacteroidales bacterium]|nr:hypothetical protein [Bacteroidales bacterium]MDZ4204751.1 hypothetical protein [Bacteroidales bacterium]